MRRTLALIAGVVASVLIIAGIGLAGPGDMTTEDLPDGGSVTVTETDTGVTFDIETDLVLGTDWFLVEDESTGSEVELRIGKDSTVLKFEAELEDNKVKTELKDVTDDDDDSDDDSDETKSTVAAESFTSDIYTLPNGAGTVTLDLTGGVLSATTTLTEGWTASEDDDSDDDDGDEFELKIRNADGSIVIEFEAELEDGQVKVEIEVENEDGDHDDDSDSSDDESDDDDDDDEELDDDDDDDDDDDEKDEDHEDEDDD